MGIIAWIVLGLIAGVLAKMIMPGRDPGGIIVTILIGIAGALVGGFVFSLFGGGGVNGVNVGSILVAGVGGLILLGLYRVLAGRRRRDWSKRPGDRRQAEPRGWLGRRPAPARVRPM